MAQEPKPIFTINAAKILAKLHLAGALQVPKENPVSKAPNAVINTGIINDQKDPNPMKLGDAEFDFSNKSGKYEVGIVTEFKYIPPYEEITSDYKKVVTANAKITDDTKKVEDTLEEENKTRKNNKGAALDKLKKEVFKDLKTYFTNFVGKENCSKLNILNVIAIPFKKYEVGDKIEFKDYTIEAYSDESELKKKQEEAKKQLEKDAKSGKTSKLYDKEISTYVCFKVGYTAVLETK